MLHDLFSFTFQTKTIGFLNDLETDKQADFVVQTIDDHKQKETARTEALNEKLKVDKAKDTIKSGGWSVNDVQLVCSIFNSFVFFV